MSVQLGRTLVFLISLERDPARERDIGFSDVKLIAATGAQQVVQSGARAKKLSPGMWRITYDAKGERKSFQAER